VAMGHSNAGILPGRDNFCNGAIDDWLRLARVASSSHRLRFVTVTFLPV